MCVLHNGGAGKKWNYWSLIVIYVDFQRFYMVGVCWRQLCSEHLQPQVWTLLGQYYYVHLQEVTLDQ